MYTEHNQTKKNKKAILLLLVLGVFGFVAFKYTKVKDIVAVDSMIEATSCTNCLVDQTPNESELVILNIDGDGEVTDITPESSVLGSTSGGCGVASNMYTADSACDLQKTTSSFGVKKSFVSTDAEITMTSISVPVRLLSGKYSIKDSNRDITLEDPVYKPAGEVFDERQVSVTFAPGESGEKTKAEVWDNTIKKKAYSTKYTISTETETGGGHVTLNTYATNDCGAKCNNDDNINPSKSNSVANYFQSISVTTPGQTSETEESDEVLIESDCSGVENVELEVEPGAIKERGCFNIWQAVQGTMQSLFPSSDWSPCDEEQESCINTETIAVKMSPMFQKVNTYTGTRVKLAMDPQTAYNYKSLYIVTSCKASVEGIVGAVPVKCIWDMSYLFNERKAAEYDDAGKSETPTLEQYKIFLKQESITRTDKLLTM